MLLDRASVTTLVADSRIRPDPLQLGRLRHNPYTIPALLTSQYNNFEQTMGFEPMTFSLATRHSTAELRLLDAFTFGDYAVLLHPLVLLELG